MGKQDLLMSDDSIPTPDQIRTACSTTIYDSNNNPIEFSTILSRKKTILLILIRHFYCGMCAAYLTAIKEDPNIGHLMNAEDGDDKAEMVVVGPGAAQNIEDYRRFAGGIKCKVYADPKTNLFKALNVTKRTLELGSNPPSHTSAGIVSITLKSAKAMITAGSKMFTGGDKSQLGAEFIFQDSQCTFAHRMSNTRDHTEVRDLVNFAGLNQEQPEKKIEVPQGVSQ